MLNFINLRFNTWQVIYEQGGRPHELRGRDVKFPPRLVIFLTLCYIRFLQSRFYVIMFFLLNDIIFNDTNKLVR